MQDDEREDEFLPTYCDECDDEVIAPEEMGDGNYYCTRCLSAKRDEAMCALTWYWPEGSKIYAIGEELLDEMCRVRKHEFVAAIGGNVGDSERRER